MKVIYYICFIILLTSCNTGVVDKSVEEPKAEDSIVAESLNENKIMEDSVEDDMIDTYFIVIADTGLDYYVLHKKMLGINRGLHIPIDTMGRFYNKTKNMIALPDDADDEIYAGDYFPRRFPAENLSLEYLDFYQPSAGEKTIALISGVYEEKNAADKALSVLKKIEKESFVIKAEVYTGCMH